MCGQPRADYIAALVSPRFSSQLKLPKMQQKDKVGLGRDGAATSRIYMPETIKHTTHETIRAQGEYQALGSTQLSRRPRMQRSTLGLHQVRVYKRAFLPEVRIVSNALSHHDRSLIPGPLPQFETVGDVKESLQLCSYPTTESSKQKVP